MIAILYSRVSSLQQKDGLGLDRQLQEQIKVCKEKGWEVLEDNVYSDIASAFHGNHLQGNLGVILDAVEAGKINKDNIIVIESLDRLGREYPLTSLKRFITILENTNVYEFSTGMTYSTNQQGFGVMVAIASFIFERAHNESLMKQKRSKSNWQQKHEQAQASEEYLAITKRAPAWIDVKEGVYVLNDNAKHVQFIFEQHNKGHAVSRIIEALQRNDVEAFGYNGKGGEWTISRINRLLANHATYGAMKSTGGEIKENRYPKVVSKQDFDKAASIKKARDTSGTRQRKQINVLSGLMKCGCCGHVYTHANVNGKNDPNNKGKRLKVRVLRCRHRMVKGDCDNKQVQYFKVLKHVLRHVKDFEYKSRVDTESLRIQLNELEGEKVGIQNLLVIDPTNKAFVSKFKKVLEQIESIQNELTQHQQGTPDTSVLQKMVRENTTEDLQVLVQRQLGLILKSVVVHKDKLVLNYVDGRTQLEIDMK